MTPIEWLRANDKPFTFGKVPDRLVARCEDCGELAQKEGERYSRQSVYEFVEKHEGHAVSVGAVA